MRTDPANRRDPGGYISVACRPSRREGSSDNRCGHSTQGGGNHQDAEERFCGKGDQPKIITRQPAPLAPIPPGYYTPSWLNSCPDPLVTINSPKGDPRFHTKSHHAPTAPELQNIAANLANTPCPPFNCNNYSSTHASVRGSRDSHVPLAPAKLADDPGRIDPGSSDRRQDGGRVDVYGDHRPGPPAHPLPGPHVVPMSAPPLPPPYSQPFWPAPPMPGPQGFPPYERTNSPPRVYPYPAQFAQYSPYSQPPHISAMPPAPPHYPMPPYQIPPPYQHPPMQPPNILPPFARPLGPPGPPGPPMPPGPFAGGPPSRPPLPAYAGLPHHPPFQAVLPPTPLNYETPPTHKFTIPPGTDTGFKITIRQEPVRARMCGFGEKDRRPIDPPPVVELHELNGPLTPADRERLVLQCTLWNEEGTEERGTIREVVGQTAGLGTAEELPIQVEQRHAKNMMGENFANVAQYEDEHGNPGLFFVFGDLSVRAEGRYRLKMDLLQLQIPGNGLPQRPGRIVAECLSHVLTVYQAKKFPGMSESSEFSKALASQGAKIKLRKKKEPRQRGPRNQPSRNPERRSTTASSEGGDDTQSPVSTRSR